MTTSLTEPVDRLAALLAHAERGAFAIALYDRLSVRRKITADLRRRSSKPVREVHLSEEERNPVGLIRSLDPHPGDVVFLCDLERGFPEALGYLDLQREVLTELGITLVCWVTTFEHRELAQKAPNFYAFRTSVFDFIKGEDLPPAQRSFIGREAELAQLVKLLQEGGNVVLTGLGGVGKTALAQKAIEQTSSHFVGGSAWVNGETGPSLEEVILTSALVLIGDVARQFRPEEQRQRLDDVLRDRPCLLVVDNFETIAEDGELLRWLRTVSPPSAALAVSRQRAPYLWAPTLTLDALSPKDAATLFTQRAQDAGWDGSGEEMVAPLCELLGYLPLAIELLAPRAAELPLAALKQMVTSSLESVAMEVDLSREERHRSIAACFQVSFDRLSEDARSLLTRLSLLPDGAGESVIGPYTGIEEWQPALAECVRHSLLQLAEERYRFHPLVRRFAQDRLGNAVSEWRQHFASFFRQLVKSNDDLNDLAKLAVLDAEWRNALAAAEAAETLKDWDTVTALSEALGEFLDLRGYWSDQETLNLTALSAARAQGDRQGESGALNSLGNVYNRQGLWAEAEKAYRSSLATRREYGDQVGVAQTLNNLGNVYESQLRMEEAEDAYQESLVIKRAIGDWHGEGQTLNNLGVMYTRQDRLNEAEEAYKSSLTIKREYGDRIGEGQSLNNLGNVYDRQGRREEAEEAFRSSLTITREYSDRVGEGQTLFNLTLFYQDQDKAAEALEFGRQALQALESTEDDSAKEKARMLVAELEAQVKEMG